MTALNLRRTLIGIIVGGIVVSVVALIVIQRADARARSEAADQELRNSMLSMSVSDEGLAWIQNIGAFQVRHAEVTLSCDGTEVRSAIVAFLDPGRSTTVDFRYPCTDGQVNVSAIVTKP